MPPPLPVPIPQQYDVRQRLPVEQFRMIQVHAQERVTTDPLRRSGPSVGCGHRRREGTERFRRFARWHAQLHGERPGRRKASRTGRHRRTDRPRWRSARHRRAGDEGTHFGNSVPGQRPAGMSGKPNLQGAPERGPFGKPRAGSEGPLCPRTPVQKPLYSRGVRAAASNPIRKMPASSPA